jgi:hypothetical protein
MDVAARLFIAGESALRSRFYAVRAAQALYMGVWLGVLERPAIHDIGRWYYSHPWKKRDVECNYLDEDYNASGLFPWEAAAIDRYFAERRCVLVGAAGAGREVIALARRGIAVTGFETNPALLAQGRALLGKLGIDAQLVAAEPDRVPEGLGQYDGAVIGWAGYMHVFGRPTRIAFLRAVRAHLRDGAPLLVSFFFRSYDTAQLRITARVASLLRRVLRKGDAQALEVGDEIAGYYRHRFNRADIELELRAAGFRPEMYSEEGYGHAVGYAD